MDYSKLEEKLEKCSSFAKTSYHPIKSKVMNGLLGGKGLPKGSVLHIAGGSGTGKSTMVMRDILKDLLQQGVDVAYIDADRGINTENLESTELDKFLGNKDKKVGGYFQSFRKTTFGEVNELMQFLVEVGFKVIVIDTISIIDGNGYLGKSNLDIENLRVGGSASTIRQLMKNINILSERGQVNFILLNHTAKEIGGNGFGMPKEEPKGGESPIAYSDIVIQLYKYSTKSEEYQGKPIGQKVYAEVRKSRHGAGKVRTPFYIRYGKGISMILTYKEIMEEHNMITRAGSKYTVKLPNGAEISYIGKENIIPCIVENYTLVDSCFSNKDWQVDLRELSKQLDIEYKMLQIDKLPKELQEERVVSNIGDKYYFMIGVDKEEQTYGVFYNIKNKKLYREFDACISVIAVSDFKKECDRLQNDVDGTKENEVKDESKD